MLYLIYQWWNEANQAGASWAETFSFLNIFKYLTVRAALACLIAFGLSLWLGPRVIRRLISLKIGQPIRTAEEVHKLHELHGAKAGTPTMGGVMIIGTITIAVLLCGQVWNPFVGITMFVMIGLGALGFMDDYTKVKLKNSEGVSSKFKLMWQACVGAVAAIFLFFNTGVEGEVLKTEKAKVEFKASTARLKQMQSEDIPRENAFWVKAKDGSAQHMAISEVGIPLLKRPIIDLSYLAIPFFIIIIIGASNAVNLTDGLDGLASGCTITTCIAYAVIAYLAGNIIAFSRIHIPFNPQLSELAVFIMAMAGSTFGFLWFNCHPAKVFMGDTGSLAIGGSIGTMAICTKQEFLLVIIGSVFVMEAVSVILQVGSFKMRGKRIFAMAPIHHHFELRGWHESQVITRFWIISIISAFIGLSLLKIV
ncbi:MAG: phospho-N-acetylmuramoyl-pentapeptide-transferase [Cryomorphaceae bacterium]|jgi:phospho-N-acetylmuramoyl-pentapeptide-transferase